MIHKHEWVVVARDALARFEKQTGQGEGSVVYCVGVVRDCAKCPVRQIVPDEPFLHIVEVEKAA